MRVQLLTFLCLAACVPDAGTPPKNPTVVAAPRCDGTVDLSPRDERGALAFASEAELAAAVGTTVYLVTSEPLRGHDARLGVGVRGLFGQPLVLCNVTAGRNRHLVVDERVVRATNVLAKTASGALVDVHVAWISPRMPWFSLALPGEALDMLVGAYREARDARQRLETLGPDPGPPEYDRASSVFWSRIARENADKIRRAGSGLTRQLVHGMGEYKRTVDRRGERVGQVFVSRSGAALAAKGEDDLPWVDHANPIVQRVLQFGIPIGPARTAYGSLWRCVGSSSRSNPDCVAADALVAAPPAIPSEATTGGTISIRIAPKRLFPHVTLEIDDQLVEVTGEVVKVPFTTDGPRVIRAVSPGMRDVKMTVKVQGGQTVETAILLLPK